MMLLHRFYNFPLSLSLTHANSAEMYKLRVKTKCENIFNGYMTD